MLVPKAAVNEYDLLSSCKYYVWRPRKFPVVEPVAVAQRVDHLADCFFHVCISALYLAHVIAAPFLRDTVCHYAAKSRGRSLMSRNRRPETMISSISWASDKASAFTALTNSGKAKW